MKYAAILALIILTSCSGVIDFHGYDATVLTEETQETVRANSVCRTVTIPSTPYRESPCVKGTMVEFSASTYELVDEGAVVQEVIADNAVALLEQQLLVYDTSKALNIRDVGNGFVYEKGAVLRWITADSLGIQTRDASAEVLQTMLTVYPPSVPDMIQVPWYPTTIGAFKLQSVDAWDEDCTESMVGNLQELAGLPVDCVLVQKLQYVNEETDDVVWAVFERPKSTDIAGIQNALAGSKTLFTDVSIGGKKLIAPKEADYQAIYVTNSPYSSVVVFIQGKQTVSDGGASYSYEERIAYDLPVATYFLSMLTYNDAVMNEYFSPLY